jgi:hypothetical protein
MIKKGEVFGLCFICIGGMAKPPRQVKNCYILVLKNRPRGKQRLCASDLSFALDFPRKEHEF